VCRDFDAFWFLRLKSWPYDFLFVQRQFILLWILLVLCLAVKHRRPPTIKLLHTAHNDCSDKERLTQNASSTESLKSLDAQHSTQLWFTVELSWTAFFTVHWIADNRRQPAMTVTKQLIFCYQQSQTVNHHQFNSQQKT